MKKSPRPLLLCKHPLKTAEMVVDAANRVRSQPTRLAGKPLFDYVADDFLAFVGDAPLVAHNAGFDIAFLNAELKRSGTPPIATERVVDTLVLARRKHPGGHNTLDDLCARYHVDRSRRSKHGALPIKDFRSDAVLTTNAEQ